MNLTLKPVIKKLTYALFTCSILLGCQHVAQAQACPTAGISGMPTDTSKFCPSDHVNSLYTLLNSIRLKDANANPGWNLQWSVDGGPFQASIDKLVPDSATNSGNHTISVRRNNTKGVCTSSNFVIFFYAQPPQVPGVVPLPAPSQPSTQRTIFICEGALGIDLNDSISKSTGYKLRFQKVVNLVRSDFNGKIDTARYTGRDTVFFVANQSPEGCSGAYSSVNVSVLPKPRTRTSPDNYQVCEGDQMKFTANDQHVGANPTYTWYLNGVQVLSPPNPAPLNKVQHYLLGPSGSTFTIDQHTFKKGDPVKVYHVVHLDAIFRDAPYFHCDPKQDSVWRSDTISIGILPHARSVFHKGSIVGPTVVYTGSQNAFYKVPLDTTLTYTWKLSNYASDVAKHDSAAGVIKSSNNTVRINFRNDLNYKLNQQFVDTVLISAKNSCDSTGDTLIVKLRPYLRPINILTPNGDGINDTWIIDYIDYPAYTVNQVTVFNRYGNAVYQSNGYSNQNAWNGTTGGRPLAEGTYYYVVLYTEDKAQKSIKGYVTILRKQL